MEYKNLDIVVWTNVFEDSFTKQPFISWNITLDEHNQLLILFSLSWVSILKLRKFSVKSLIYFCYNDQGSGEY